MGNKKQEISNAKNSQPCLLPNSPARAQIPLSAMMQVLIALYLRGFLCGHEDTRGYPPEFREFVADTWALVEAEVAHREEYATGIDYFRIRLADALHNRDHTTDHADRVARKLAAAVWGNRDIMQNAVHNAATLLRPEATQ